MPQQRTIGPAASRGCAGQVQLDLATESKGGASYGFGEPRHHPLLSPTNCTSGRGQRNFVAQVERVMAWEQRANSGGRYYYRVRRDGDNVTKEYFGCGAAAKQAAAEDLRIRQRRQQDYAHWLQMSAQLDDASDPGQQLAFAAGLLTHATLLVCGFYRDKNYHWRRRM